MRLNQEEVVLCDVLVIGGGGAGIRAAIAAKATGARVMMASKYRIGQSSNTNISKGIIACSGLGQSEDNSEVHATDMMSGGRFLNDAPKVAEITRRAVSEISFLQKCGVAFGMDGQKFRLMHTSGHRFPRHIYGENWKGSDIVVPLKRYAKEMGVIFMEHIFITRILTSDKGVAGACGVTPAGDLIPFQATAVVLATGGYAHVFRNTNNAPGITGDGQALCYDLGVPLQDMEFVQFYPTARGKNGTKLLLNEKLLVQPGVMLKNQHGEDILKKHGITDFMSLTRDHLAQLMMRESQEGTVYFDIEALSNEKAIPLTPLLPAPWWKGRKIFPVVPTAHFCMGGVKTDALGQTSLQGLFAVGEVSAGAHGANRLGGNALAEIFTMGAVAGAAAGTDALAARPSRMIGPMAKDEKLRLEETCSSTGLPPAHAMRELKELMWTNAGIIRCPEGLNYASALLRHPCPEIRITSSPELIHYLEYLNMRVVSKMVCMAALKRTESRGSHYRIDFPGEDNEQWLKNIVVQKESSGMVCHTVPVQNA
ncbi:MAG: FAD-binding protein [Desulfatitalea sp.]|nr:FAD-binding protein [Desulfatitalea sp.]